MRILQIPLDRISQQRLRSEIDGHNRPFGSRGRLSPEIAFLQAISQRPKVCQVLLLHDVDTQQGSPGMGL
jgi:hypothetical protein